MNNYSDQIKAIQASRDQANLQVTTMGSFDVIRDGTPVHAKEWGRDLSIQLFQFFITARHRHALHKEQIIDRLWEDMDGKSGEQSFKVAQHGINKALEPNRQKRAEPKYIIRQGISYQLNQYDIWIDADAMEQLIIIGNQAVANHPEDAIMAYQGAVDMYKGIYLPNRVYNDWTSDERERLQVLILGAAVNLSELMLSVNPMESVRLAQQALIIDPAWEDAYRIQMHAYYLRGNRPMAIKTYRRCVEILEEEFGVEPLPQTKRLMEQIQSGDLATTL